VQPSVTLSFARYKSQPIFDTVYEWNKWDMRKLISLDELTRVLGMRSSKDSNINGSRVYERFCEGCHKEIADYCMRDVRLTRSIYYRLTQPEKAESE
jgi:predicted PolB exonuclease-like 3'-5' exonuclease